MTHTSPLRSSTMHRSHRHPCHRPRSFFSGWRQKCTVLRSSTPLIVMLSQSASWSESPIFEAVRNYCRSDALTETIITHQADINVKCKTLSLGVFHERSPLHLAIDDFLEPEVIEALVKFGADARSKMTEIKDGSISIFDCSQRLEYVRTACSHPSSRETENLAHLDWCGRTFSQEWCQFFLI
jgi:hypothetical protein